MSLDVSTVDKILKGIEIIRKYQPDAWFAAEHDVIYFGDYNATAHEMTPDEQQTMSDYGWHEQFDSWARFV